MLTDGAKPFHLCINPADLGAYVFLAGDPGRIPQIAAHFDNAREMACNREFRVYTGTLDGQSVSALSTGIGGPSAAIAVEEAVQCGAHTFIRVGTSGGMALSVVAGDLVLASAAIRGDGTSREYLPSGYPAVADFSVLSALRDSAEALSDEQEGSRYHIGVVQSKDSFYGETNPESMPLSPMLLPRWQAYLQCGCLASEMECASLFSVALVRGVRAGAVLTAIWNVERSKAGLDETVRNDSDRAIRCAVDAVRRLMADDARRAGR